MSVCACQDLQQEFGPLHPECLGGLWLFRGLCPEDAGALADRALRRRRPLGTRLFGQGEPATEMFLLKAGFIKLTRQQPDGTEVPLGIRGPGSLVGETVLTEAGTYPLSAWCMEDCLTCGFTRSGFESLVLDHPGIGLQLLRNMSERIERLTDLLESSTAASLEERLLGTLTLLAREHGIPEGNQLRLPFNLTHEELGLLVGAHRVSVTRAMGRLQSRRLLKSDRQGLVLSRI
nr:Crp/Fnr family transcriptional regulator [uncultured Holophaga sp.]